MTQHYHYSSPQTPTANRFDVDLGTSAIRLGDIPGWATAADAGDVAQNGVAIDDPTSTAGMSNDGILGLKTFYVTEDACAAVGADGVNGQRLWTGYITDRDYRRGNTPPSTSLITGPARRIDISLQDVNALAAFRVIHASNTILTGTVSKNGTTTVSGSGTQFLTELAPGSTISIPGGGGVDTLYVSSIASDTSLTTVAAATHTASGQVGTRIDGGRPAETDVQRVRWIISGVPAYFPVTDDAGYFDTSSPVMMDACDYTDQTPADVMHDCALASGKNWFVLYWEATGTDAIWYADSNTSTAYTSLLSLSNDLADVNNTTCFAYMPDLKLNRSPSKTFAGVSVPYANGRTYRTLPSTANLYAWRDGTAPTSNVKTLALAERLGDRLLAAAATEEDRITGRVQLPASLATGIKAGQRLQLKASYLGFNGSNTSYTSFTWMRVARLSVAQDEETDQRYTLSFELTPQTTVCAATLIQSASRGGDAGTSPGAALANPVTAGSLLVWGVINNGADIATFAPADTGSWTQIGADTALGDDRTGGLYYKVADGTEGTDFYRTGGGGTPDVAEFIAEFSTGICTPSLDTSAFIDGGYGSPYTVSGSITPGASSGLLVALLVAEDQNTPAVGAFSNLSAGWHAMEEKWAQGNAEPGTGNPRGYFVYQPLTSPTGSYTVSADFVPGYSVFNFKTALVASFNLT